MPKEYRSRPRITLEILRAIKDEPGIGTTRLLSHANMSTERLQAYLAELESRGLIHGTTVQGRRGYSISPAGQVVLTELDRVDRFMADFGMGL